MKIKDFANFMCIQDFGIGDLKIIINRKINNTNVSKKRFMKMHKLFIHIVNSIYNETTSTSD
jgi:hypothetical protein